MSNLQKIIILAYAALGLLGAIKGFVECKKKNTIGPVGIFNLYGAFVWADIVIFGFFWFIASLTTIILNDWILFLLIQSLFWVVRSLGETVYWFNQQFSTINRNPAKNYWFFKYFQDEYTVWFVMQIVSQCITVTALVLALYFGKIWLTR